MSAYEGLTPAQVDTAFSLLLDAVTADAAARLRVAGIRSILLRGPSVARWLYDQGELRPYEDVDLLVASEDVERAGQVLTDLGFRRVAVEIFPEGRHARVWKRDADGMTVDLHRTLVGATASMDVVWSTLSLDAEEMAVGGGRVEVLGEPARAVVVALHAAQHGNWWAKCLEDLDRALTRVPLETWQRAATVATRIGGVAAFRAGLGLFPAGEQLVSQLALPNEHTVESSLRAGTAPHTALGFLRLFETRGLRGKAGFLVRKLAPPPAYLRATSQLARRGPLGLAAGYVVRPAWLVWHAVPGFVAWRRARRVRSD